MKGRVRVCIAHCRGFMLDLHTEQHGYSENTCRIWLTDTLYGTGQLPRIRRRLVYMRSLEEEAGSGNALIPRRRVPLTNLVRDEIIDEDQLPIKMTAHTPCFQILKRV